MYTLAKRSDTQAKDPTVHIRVWWITEEEKNNPMSSESFGHQNVEDGH